MSKYDKWANDPEASIAFNVLTDIIAGVGYHTEMAEDVDENHANKQTIDEYGGPPVNLDEKLQEITMTFLQKGFCPVERLAKYDLRLLPPEMFYIWRNKHGYIYRYTQERNPNQVIACWEDPMWKSKLEKLEEAYDPNEYKELLAYEAPKDITSNKLDDIILFKHRATTSWPYGKSLVEPIGGLLDDRGKMNKDMAKAVHKWGYRTPVVSTARSKDKIQEAFTERDVDEAVFIGNMNEGEFKMDILGIDPQARFIPFIELIYYQICEGLHAPLLLYLKNATEASATVMLESVDRLVNGIQRYIKRRVEQFLFEPQVGEPVPRLIWGQPKTGLEDVTLTDVAAVINSPKVPMNQVQYILKQYFSKSP